MRRPKVVITPELLAQAEAYIAVRRRWYDTDSDLPEAFGAKKDMGDAACRLADEAVRLILGAEAANAAAFADREACEASSARFMARLRQVPS